MHRSGTSLITRSLASLNVNFSNNPIPPAPDNPKGFWEDSDIVKLNEEMLKACNTSWSNSNLMTQEDIDHLVELGYSRRAEALIRNKTDGRDTLAIKDPRMAKLLAFWRIPLENTNINISYIYVIRNPLSVANSLYSRNKMNLATSAILWASYNLEILKNLQSEPFTYIEYERFIETPLKELVKIQSHTGRSIDSEKYVEFIESYFDKKFQHHQFNLSQLLNNPDLPNVAKEIYRSITNGNSSILLNNKATCNQKIREWTNALNDLNLIQEVSELEKLKLTTQTEQALREAEHAKQKFLNRLLRIC